MKIEYVLIGMFAIVVVIICIKNLIDDYIDITIKRDREKYRRHFREEEYIVNSQECKYFKKEGATASVCINNCKYYYREHCRGRDTCLKHEINAWSKHQIEKDLEKIDD